MDFPDYLARLDEDFAILRDIADGDLTPRVPTCPEWTLDDLVRHVAVVYLHKAASMREGAMPTEWPPDLSAEAAPELLRRAYAELTAEFAAREPADRAHTWYEPDQTVGFWIRRMALETAVHRVDAELAAGKATPVDAALAVDGVDEILHVMVAWGSVFYQETREADLPTVEIRSGGRSWYVHPTTKGVVVDETGDAAATIAAEPSAMLLWLWGRAGDEAVTVIGDKAAAGVIRELMHTATE